MIERYITGCAVEDPLLELPAQTRERLKDCFPRGATRRMTQLGMLVGSVLRSLKPEESSALVYATRFAENQALEEYLASFPTPSPTLFQTSIHPSAVQQVLIARQQPIRELFPLTGNAQLGAHSLQMALLAPGPRVILCGGEERGTWLREHGSASEETFAFAVGLSHAAAGSIGKLSFNADTKASEASATQALDPVGQDGDIQGATRFAAPTGSNAWVAERSERFVPVRGQATKDGWTGGRGALSLRELFDIVRDRRGLKRELSIGGILEISWL